VILLGSVEGGSSLGLSIFFLIMVCARCALLEGYFWMGEVTEELLFLEKKDCLSRLRSLLFIDEIDLTKINLGNLDNMS
jgi:hypothetical protein